MYVTQEMTLDLNGSTITGNGSRFIAVRRGGKLTIKDESGNGTITNNSIPLRVIDGGELIVESGNIVSTGSSAITVGQKTAPGGKVVINGGNIKAQEVCALATYPGAVIEINGGNLESVDNFVVGGNGSEGQGETNIVINGGDLTSNISSAGYVACGIYHPQKGTLGIHGGNITANNGAGIVVRGGEVTIDGGTITALGDKDLVGKVGDSAIQVPTSAVVVDKKAKYYDADNILVTISNNAEVIGSNSAIAAVVDTDQTVDGQIEVSGGKFSNDVSEYTSSGYNCVEDTTNQI